MEELNFCYIYEFKDGQVADSLTVCTSHHSVEDGLKTFHKYHDSWGDKIVAYRMGSGFEVAPNGNEVFLLPCTPERDRVLKLHNFI